MYENTVARPDGTFEITIKSITYTGRGGDTAMAIGEFGIGPTSASHSTHH